LHFYIPKEIQMAYYQTDALSASITALNVATTGTLPVRRPAPIGDDVGTELSVKGSISFASGINLAVNDVIELVVLPADHVPIDFFFTADQFDSNATPTLAANIGLMTGTVGDTTRIQTAVGTDGAAAMKWGSLGGCSGRAGESNGTAAALTIVPYATTISRAAVVQVDRSYGMAITALAATNPATVRRLDFTLKYRVGIGLA
jgi:hypothetical protein